jgi:hypothetical protein
MHLKLIGLYSNIWKWSSTLIILIGDKGGSDNRKFGYLD